MTNIKNNKKIIPIGIITLTILIVMVLFLTKDQLQKSPSVNQGKSVKAIRVKFGQYEPQLIFLWHY